MVEIKMKIDVAADAKCKCKCRRTEKWKNGKMCMSASYGANFKPQIGGLTWTS